MNITKVNTKKIIQLNKSEWEKIMIHDMRVDINIIRCKKRLFNDSKEKKLLYIGFGEGQNLLYFLSEGFKCYGTEIVEKRLNFLKKKIRKMKQQAILKLVDSNVLPFNDNFFDVVVAWQSICYNNEAGLKEILDEILRVLRPGGHFLSSIPSPKHNLCGKEVAPSVFKPVNTPDQTKCLLYAFKNKKQIRKMYHKFKNIKIGFHSSYLFTSRDFHYVIYCRKAKNKY